MDSSPPNSSVHGILQARSLEWVAISFSNACLHATSLQSCPTLCDPMDRNPPGSSVHGILQVRILEQVTISSSRGSSQPRDQTPVSCIAGRFFTSEVGIKPQLNSRVREVLRKRIENHFTSCTSGRLNPHNQLGRLCVYGTYKRSLRAPTKENTLALVAVDIGGKNTQE